MAFNYTFRNVVSSAPINNNVAECNSWIQVDNNAGRPLFANASYITNLDNLSISLSSGNLDIGAVHIIDKDSGLAVTIADVGTGVGAMRVLSQDLEPVHDTISIGDVNGKLAYVTASALNVFNTNPISSITVNNPITAVQILNPVSAFSLTNQITSVFVTNFPTQLTAVSITNQLTSTSVTVLNPVNSVTILNPVTTLSATILNPSIEISNDIGNPVPVSFTSSISGNVGVSMALNWGITIVAVTSSAYVQFPSNVAHIASLMNTTGGVLYVGKWNNSSTVGLPLLNNSTMEINLTGNTNEIGVKSTLAGTVSAYAMYTDWNS